MSQINGGPIFKHSLDYLVELWRGDFNLFNNFKIRPSLFQLTVEEETKYEVFSGVEEQCKKELVMHTRTKKNAVNTTFLPYLPPKI